MHIHILNCLIENYSLSSHFGLQSCVNNEVCCGEVWTMKTQDYGRSTGYDQKFEFFVSVCHQKKIP